MRPEWAQVLIAPSFAFYTRALQAERKIHWARIALLKPA